MNELQVFINEMTSFVDEKSGDFRFVLVRWSKKEPYWCVFACEMNGKGFSGIEGASGIGGHYCIGKEEKLHDVLSILADSGWKTEIHPYYFLNSDI